ncbi:hypothetical protein ACIP88_05035 [Streptomyces uncialis]|uniref:deoxynucleotide monophosphate kinase family protein n=1 Tax=Streptomyces uncialis TaxID=1048205 RepID=UPI0037F43382
MNIGCIGRARAGKDTVGQWLVEHRGYRRVGFADPLKEAALKLDPLIYTDHPSGTERLSEILSEPHALTLEIAKDMFPEIRRVLQELGAAVRGLDPDFWLRLALTKVMSANDGGTACVITDVRYPNEAESLRAAGFHLIYVHRPDVPHLNHESEGALSAEDADHLIINTGTVADLHRELRLVVDRIDRVESRRHWNRSH